MQEEAFNMCSNKDNKVVMHNNLIKAKSNLSLNEIKLLRITIMQVIRADKDFKTYKVGIKDLADMLNINYNGMYKEIFKICDNLMSEKLYVNNGINKSWKIFHWCSSCYYNNGVITIRLHDELKPYLLELNGLYTQYVLADVLLLKSIHSIRIYELIVQEMKYQKVYADNEANIYLSIETIRKVTNTEDKYIEKYSMFEKRIVRSSIEEINNKLSYIITYTRSKNSRKVVGYMFNIKSKIYESILHTK